ncbi:MAG TPA: pyrroline-5-carboxylate reductase [Usitatibacter sp.]|nr:pyrroline-5-carboxylate reductase [Usitatibacter sp.]
MNLAFIGGGNMARAIIGGLVARGTAPSAIGVAEPDAATRERLAAELGVSALANADASLAGASTIVFAVKPQQMRGAARSCAPYAGKALIVSIAAGIRIEDLSRWLGGHERIVRAMPNTPALVHAGVTGLCARPSVVEADRNAATSLLMAVGDVLWFDREDDLDAVTAVSGSGPAYVFYAIEALEQAARELGLSPDASRALALGTFSGAAKLAVARGEDPAVLRAQVTSKGGTTERALEVLEQAQVKRQFVAAVKAACERSRELGHELGKDPQ